MVVCSSCVARIARRGALRWGPASWCSQPSSMFELAYARYTHPLDQEADEGSLVVPQVEASEDADGILHALSLLLVVCVSGSPAGQLGANNSAS
jgi:hypothetical protein